MRGGKNGELVSRLMQVLASQGARVLDAKGEDYPAEQRDRGRLVFFVQCGGGAALADLSLAHSRHALLTCCFLADHEVGQEWIVTQEVRGGIEAALGLERRARHFRILFLIAWRDVTLGKKESRRRL